MDRQTIDELKDCIKDAQLGISLMPPGSITPELVEAVRKCNEKLAAVADRKPVRLATHKPTEQEIMDHRIRTGQAFFGAIPAGIEPRPNRPWA